MGSYAAVVLLATPVGPLARSADAAGAVDQRTSICCTSGVSKPISCAMASVMGLSQACGSMTANGYVPSAYAGKVHESARALPQRNMRFHSERPRRAMDRIKYPYIRMKLTGESSNPLAIIGRVERAMRQAGVSQDAIDEYRLKALNADFHNLLKVTLATVRCR